MYENSFYNQNLELAGLALRANSRDSDRSYKS